MSAVKEYSNTGLYAPASLRHGRNAVLLYTPAQGGSPRVIISTPLVTDGMRLSTDSLPQKLSLQFNHGYQPTFSSEQPAPALSINFAVRNGSIDDVEVYEHRLQLRSLKKGREGLVHDEYLTLCDMLGLPTRGKNKVHREDAFKTIYSTLDEAIGQYIADERIAVPALQMDGSYGLDPLRVQHVSWRDASSNYLHAVVMREVGEHVRSSTGLRGNGAMSESKLEAIARWAQDNPDHRIHTAKNNKRRAEERDGSWRSELQEVA